MSKVEWKPEPEDHDYPAAADYLSLLIHPALSERIVDGLRATVVVVFKAKDLLRASQLPLLPVTNAHVRKDLKKVSEGEALSPVLLVRGDALRGYPLQIADGYHRVCAAYHLDENVEVPAKIVASNVQPPHVAAPVSDLESFRARRGVL
jgi:hypothetical protein